MKRLYYEQERHINAALIDFYTVSKVRSYLTQEQAFCCDYYEIIYIESGQGELLVDEQLLSFTSGQFIFFKPYQLRRFIGNAYASTNLIFFDTFFQVFFTDARFLSKVPMFNAINRCVFTPEAENEVFFKATFRKIMETLENRGQSNVEHITRGLLYYLLSNASRDADIGKVNSASVVIQLRNLIDQYYLDHTSIKFYANKMQCGVHKVQKLCQVYHGMSFAKVLKQRLLLEAKRELLHTSKSISEIAYHLNFSDASNFTRFFKQQTGIVPLAFRNKQRSERT